MNIDNLKKVSFITGIILVILAFISIAVVFWYRRKNDELVKENEKLKVNNKEYIEERQNEMQQNIDIEVENLIEESEELSKKITKLKEKFNYSIDYVNKFNAFYHKIYSSYEKVSKGENKLLEEGIKYLNEKIEKYDIAINSSAKSLAVLQGLNSNLDGIKEIVDSFPKEYDKMIECLDGNVKSGIFLDKLPFDKLGEYRFKMAENKRGEIAEWKKEVINSINALNAEINNVNLSINGVMNEDSVPSAWKMKEVSFSEYLMFLWQYSNNINEICDEILNKPNIYKRINDKDYTEGLRKSLTRNQHDDATNNKTGRSYLEESSCEVLKGKYLNKG